MKKLFVAYLIQNFQSGLENYHSKLLNMRICYKCISSFQKGVPKPIPGDADLALSSCDRVVKDLATFCH